MNIEEAINIVSAMNIWRRGVGSKMPHTPREFGEAIDALIEHAERTTWQPIDTLTKDAGDSILVCSKGDRYPATVVREGNQWTFVEGDDLACLGSLLEDCEYWMPLPEPPEL